MSITAETAKQHANDPAVLCCRAEAGTELTPANATGESELVLEGGIYVGTISGIAPKDMGDTYYFCLYTEDEAGAAHYSELGTYSIHEYTHKRADLYATTPDGDSNKPLYALCQAIINYSYQANAKLNTAK